MAQNLALFSARVAGLTSALSLGLLSAPSLPSAKAQSIAASNRCPESAAVVQSDEVVPVTKATYAAAGEIQTVFAKYIANVAKESCSGGVGVLWNDSKASGKGRRGEKMSLRVHM